MFFLVTPSPGFPFNVNSPSLSLARVWPQGSGGFRSVFLLLDRLPSLVDESYLSEVSGFETPDIPAFAPSPVSINTLATGRPGAGLGPSEALLLRMKSQQH